MPSTVHILAKTNSFNAPTTHGRLLDVIVRVLTDKETEAPAVKQLWQSHGSNSGSLTQAQLPGHSALLLLRVFIFKI